MYTYMYNLWYTVYMQFSHEQTHYTYTYTYNVHCMYMYMYIVH